MLSFVHCCAAAIQLSRSVYSVSVIVHLLHLPVCPEENCSFTVSCRASKPVSVKAQVSSHVACEDAEYFFSSSDFADSSSFSIFFGFYRCTPSGHDAAPALWVGICVNLKPAVRQIQDPTGSPHDCRTIVSAGEDLWPFFPPRVTEVSICGERFCVYVCVFCDPVRPIWSLWSSCYSAICSSEIHCRSGYQLNTGNLWLETSWCSLLAKTM